MRLVRAEVLKLVRRRGLMAWSLLLTVGVVLVAVVVLVTLHAVNSTKHGPAGGADNLQHLVFLIAGLSNVAAIIIGATAGTQDVGNGVFRGLVVTGRKRATLFAVRVPGALIVFLPMLALALAIAIGSPLGQSNSVTKGVISALHRSLQVPDPANPGATEDILNAIQTDASINPGNSGGPLLNSGGQVVGVNFAIEQAQSGPGLGFALDGDAARDIANQLIQTGHVNQPFLGVSYQQLDETAAAASAPPRPAAAITL